MVVNWHKNPEKIGWMKKCMGCNPSIVHYMGKGLREDQGWFLVPAKYSEPPMKCNPLIQNSRWNRHQCFHPRGLRYATLCPFS